MPFGDFPPAGYKPLLLKSEVEAKWTEIARFHGLVSDLVPVLCDQCNRSAGYMLPALRDYMREHFCSDNCRVLAEWYAPERR